MEFRPCIDIHNGKIKQIVGSTLKDTGDEAVENYVSEQGGDYYARLYKDYNLPGGHVILLNSKDSPYYEATRQQAIAALRAFPGGMMVGGGITDENALSYLNEGASHVVVTSFCFKDGKINLKNLTKLADVCSRDKIVLDLSCRLRDGKYIVVTDRWQKFTTQELTVQLFDELSAYCDEFLVHAVDTEGKSSGIDERVMDVLTQAENQVITYAGGISSYDDIKKLSRLGKSRVNFTVGSKLDLFGGDLSIEGILECIR